MHIHMFDNSHTLRASVLSGTSLFVAAVSFVFGIYNLFFNQSYSLAIFDFLFACYSGYTYLLTKNNRHKKIHLQIFVYLIVFMAIVGVYILPVENGTYVWTVSFPILFYAMLGLNHGQIASGGFLLIQLLNIYATKSQLEFYETLPVFGNLICCYITVWIVAHIYEYNRRNIENSLTYLASRDSLTGAHNRLSLTSTYDYFEKHKNKQSSLCLLFIDLDYFKQVNDRYGHDAGDKVLIETASLFGQVVGDDNLYRIGGEEFCVTLFDQSIDQAEIVAERIRELMSQHVFRFGDKHIQITLSVGICEYSDGDQLSDLLKLADKQLYQAKTNGRNQVRFNKTTNESESVDCMA